MFNLVAASLLTNNRVNIPNITKTSEQIECHDRYSLYL